MIRGDSGIHLLTEKGRHAAARSRRHSGYFRTPDTGEFEVGYSASAASFAAKVVSAGSTAPWRDRRQVPVKSSCRRVRPLPAGHFTS